MKVRFLANTNIRITPYDLSIPPVGILFGGTEIEVENSIFNGVPIDGVHAYFRDTRGWYYWTGKAAILYSELPQGQHSSTIGEAEIVEEDKIDIIEHQPMEHQSIESQSSAPVSKVKVPEVPVSAPRLTKEKPLFSSISRIPEPTDFDASPPSVPQPDYSTIETFQIIKETDIPNLFWKRQELTGEGINIGVIYAENFSIPQFSMNPTSPNKTSTNKLDTYLQLMVGGLEDSKTGIAPNANIITRPIRDLKNKVLALKNEIQLAAEQGARILLILVDLKNTEITEVQKNELQEIIDLYSQKGLLFLTPVGSGNFIKPVKRFPANFPNCLCVGAYNPQQQRTASSQKSMGLDILAPGYDSEILRMEDPTRWATAYTAGVLALIVEKLGKENRHLTGANLIQLIRNSAQKTNGKIHNSETGYGIFSPEKLLEVVSRKRQF